MIGITINGSTTNPIRLSEYVEKPALLNADTAWKSPCHNASPQVSSYANPNRKARIAVSAVSTVTVASSDQPEHTRHVAEAEGLGFHLGDKPIAEPDPLGYQQPE